MRRAPWFLALLVLAFPLIAEGTPTHYTGTAVVRTIDDTRVAVFLDTDGDETIDEGFLLSADLPFGKLAVRLDKARVVFSGSYVRVTADQKLYDLQVAGYPEPPEAPEDSDLVTLIGYALVHSSGDSGCNLERAHNADAGACFAYGIQ
jgi:hypothetical protein